MSNPEDYTKDMCNPSNWNVHSNDGTQLSASNLVTGAQFNGSPDEFKVFINSFALDVSEGIFFYGLFDYRPFEGVPLGSFALFSDRSGVYTWNGSEWSAVSSGTGNLDFIQQGPGNNVEISAIGGETESDEGGDLRLIAGDAPEYPGDVVIRGGDLESSEENIGESGAVDIRSGSAQGFENSTGEVIIRTRNGFSNSYEEEPGTFANSGEINIYTGVGYSTGSVNIFAGNAIGAEDLDTRGEYGAGGVNIRAGAPGGEVNILGGDSFYNVTNYRAGSVRLAAGIPYGEVSGGHIFINATSSGNFDNAFNNYYALSPEDQDKFANKNQGGDIYIQSGDGKYEAGKIYIDAGRLDPPTDVSWFSGGSINIAAGDAVDYSDFSDPEDAITRDCYGGTLELEGGSGFNGGYVNIYGGDSTSLGDGGFVRIYAGDGGDYGDEEGSPGWVDIRGGSGRNTDGSNVYITGGSSYQHFEGPPLDPESVRNGGDVYISGGYSGLNGNGGSVFIQGGQSSNDGLNGDVVLSHYIPINKNNPIGLVRLPSVSGMPTQAPGTLWNSGVPFAVDIRNRQLVLYVRGVWFTVPLNYDQYSMDHVALINDTLSAPNGTLLSAYFPPQLLPFEVENPSGYWAGRWTPEYSSYQPVELAIENGGVSNKASPHVVLSRGVAGSQGTGYYLPPAFAINGNFALAEYNGAFVEISFRGYSYTDEGSYFNYQLSARFECHGVANTAGYHQIVKLIFYGFSVEESQLIFGDHPNAISATVFDLSNPITLSIICPAGFTNFDVAINGSALEIGAVQGTEQVVSFTEINAILSGNSSTEYTEFRGIEFTSSNPPGSHQF